MVTEDSKKWYERERWTKERYVFLAKIIIPLILLIISFVVKKSWGSQILSFTQENKWLILVGVALIIIYTSWTFPKFFKKYNQNLRRTWYFFFIIGMILLLNQSGFDVKEWQRYTLLAGMFIFVDLALFLTPSIKKIGGAEMEPITEVESINEEMHKVITQTQNRNLQFTSILDSVKKSSFGTQEWQDAESYRDSLEDFLMAYGETCRQELTVFVKQDDGAFKQEIGTIIGVNLTEDQMKFLNEKKVVHIDKFTILVPYLKHTYPVVIAIVSEIDILDIDIDHIINLSVIHTWVEKAQPQQPHWQSQL
ncbi:type II toxin-antitoxin system SpoIISA family toxin [Neobacillus cucumis]|nr:type II toxin-antitoxin system SpoIISA family toxin [Neobacillus cucumis]